VKRRERRLHEQRGDDERERDDYEAVGVVSRECSSQLREVERTGPAVEQRGPEQDHERGDRVRDREIQCPL
jgi:hypothetical protein